MGPYEGFNVTTNRRNFNPYYTNPEVAKSNAQAFGAISGVYDAFQDNTNYWGNNQLSNMGNIGSTATGSTMNQVGNAAKSTGNPYAVAGGMSLKHIGGGIDVGKYLLKRNAPEINSSYSSANLNPYDLADEFSTLNDMKASRTGMEAAKKMALGGPLVAGGAYLLASRKANKLKQQGLENLQTATNAYNAANDSFYDNRNAMARYNQMRAQDAYNIPGRLY